MASEQDEPGGFHCSAEDCEFWTDDWDEIESVDGRGWGPMKELCPTHAEAVREGTLERRELYSTYTEETSDDTTGFVQMRGGRRRGFPPQVDDREDMGTFPIDDYTAKIKRSGTCPHEGCDFRGTLLKVTGHNCPHMCPECGGIVHA